MISPYCRQIQRNQSIVSLAWKKNTIALNLYTNAGFAEVAEIIQTKQTPDKTGTYNMLKVYLQKNTTHAAINFKNH